MGGGTFALFLFAATVFPRLVGAPPLEVRLITRMTVAPSDMLILVIVERDPRNRWVQVEADCAEPEPSVGIPDWDVADAPGLRAYETRYFEVSVEGCYFYRSSGWGLDGANEPRVFPLIVWRGLLRGRYEVRAWLTERGGRRHLVKERLIVQ